MSKRDVIARVAARRWSRGVAMVEGGIIAPIFAMMMMMTVYLGGVYQTKYKSFMRSRNTTWTSASVGCKSGESLPGMGDQVPSTGGGNSPTGAVDSGSSNQVSSSFYIANGSDTEVWDYSPTYKFNNGGPMSIKTESHVMCNEIPEGRNIFSYLWNAISGLIP